MSVYDIDAGEPSLFEYLNAPRPRELCSLIEITEGAYDYFLNVLPPIYVPDGFAMMEADSDQDGCTVRSVFTQQGAHYFHEWRAFKPGERGYAY